MLALSEYEVPCLPWSEILEECVAYNSEPERLFPSRATTRDPCWEAVEIVLAANAKC